VGVAFWVGAHLGDNLPRERFAQTLYMVLIILGVTLLF
jgi:hypothetical protein